MRLSDSEIPSDSDGRRRAGRPGVPRDRRTPRARRLGIAAAVAALVVVGGLSTGVAPSRAAAPAPASLTAASASQVTGASASQFQFSAEPYAAPGSQQRSQFIYQLQAGHTIRDQVVIKNLSTIDETFLVYGEDATNVPRTGGYAYEQRSQMHNTEVGKWLNIGFKRVTVPAGQQVVDTFALSIPSNAPPGDHVGAVVVEQVKGPVSPQPTGVNLILRIAVPMFVRVVGKTYPGLTVENLQVFHQSPAVPYVGGSAKVAVRFQVVNTGNVILDPESVTTSITGRLSGTIHTFTTHQTGKAQSRANPLPLQMLPGGKLTLTERWTGIPPIDPLTASVTARAVDPSTKHHVSTTASTKFWYFPWIVLLVLLALILLVIGLIWNRRRRRAKAAAAAAAAAAGGAEGAGGEPGGGKPPSGPSVPESGTLEEAPR